MVRTARAAAEGGARLVVFPELSLTGYPPRDLVEKPSFLERTEQHLARLAAETADLDVALICGYVGRSEVPAGKRATNSAAVVERGRVVFRQNKALLPTYDVFDEARYFQPAERQSLCAIGGQRVALTICEDAWNDKQFWERRLYRRDPVEELAQAGRRDAHQHQRLALPHGQARAAARDLRQHGAALQDPGHLREPGGRQRPLVFDGSSFALDAEARVIASGASFREDLVFVDTATGAGDQHENLPEECEAVYEALVLGTRDYIRKCGFQRVLMGLSGGIDSSLTAAIAVDAVGRENVVGRGDARAVFVRGQPDGRAGAGGESGHPLRGGADHAGSTRSFSEALDPLFAGCARDVTEENLQARLRGVNADGALEQVGRAGADHGQQERAGGGLLHAVRRHVRRAGGDQRRAQDPGLRAGAGGEPAPRGRHPGERVRASRPRPSCGPNQKDQDSLPPYDVLDRILRAYVEEYQTPRRDRRDAGPGGRSLSARSSTRWTATSTSASRRRPA